MSDQQKDPAKESRKAPEPSGVDLARQALAAAREQARARGNAASGKKRHQPGLRSGARADGRDPMPLMAALDRLRTERGWEMPMAVAGVMERWPEIVGPEIAAHCEPDRYEDRELVVRCDSSAWAAQLKLLAPQLVARLNADLGQGTVRLIKVQGPGGRPKRYGPWRAPGSTGPGDTYA
ncbi:MULTISPECIES: DUF721 domain-containing protein [unclassified Streptomyces]|uniref:DUF721 domain-containing protein n=1 Tax=unclassified Streptomyces TaxID=2593676 RepID=UPI001BEC1DF0|nr:MULTISPECIES: DUF721 domain-containing protein [unclassified Streptomyces]MBT2402725.1 DUF721 domain-containing protein [Streptomyces sp. ISL-21]MBT2454470.1 DUF721 domain-containing protein [Streptomyces sp. ISL-86]MBT2607317.1 DUF721 domain-containing protein [Streptomyces sp. ISL-87]